MEVRVDTYYDRGGVIIYNGDCVSILGEVRYNLVVTSPPYWNQREYSWWPEYGGYMESVRGWVRGIYGGLESGRHCFWVIPDKLPWPPSESGLAERVYLPVYSDTERAAMEVGFSCEFPIIWKKPHGSQKMFGSYPYPPTIIHTPMTERICVWRKPGVYERRDLGVKALSRFSKDDWVLFAQDLWEIPPGYSRGHPAIFPIELPLRVIKLWSFVGDVVLDPFLGSGTTLVAALMLGRGGIGIEISEEYCEVAARAVDNYIDEFG